MFWNVPTDGFLGIFSYIWHWLFSNGVTVSVNGAPFMFSFGWMMISVVIIFSTVKLIMAILNDTVL